MRDARRKRGKGIVFQEIKLRGVNRVDIWYEIVVFFSLIEAFLDNVGIYCPINKMRANELNATFRSFELHSVLYP